MRVPRNTERWVNNRAEASHQPTRQRDLRLLAKPNGFSPSTVFAEIDESPTLGIAIPRGLADSRITDHYEPKRLRPAQVDNAIAKHMMLPCRPERPSKLGRQISFLQGVAVPALSACANLAAAGR